jgi:hypothetical protein
LGRFHRCPDLGQPRVLTFEPDPLFEATVQ